MPGGKYRSVPSTVYNTAGATLSEKNACAEFGVTVEDLKKGFEAGKLQIQHRSIYGNSYRLYIRSQVADYAKELLGPKFEIDEAKKGLRGVVKELADIEAKKAELEDMKRTLGVRKEYLEQKIKSLGGSLEEPKTKAKPGKKRARKDSVGDWKPGCSP
jgi:chromosome segregation ATPase